MRSSVSRTTVALIAASLGVTLQAQGLERGVGGANRTVLLTRAVYQGRPAIRVVDNAGASALDPLVRLPLPGFRNGTIEADVAGLPAAGAGDGARGFIGIAFRVQPDPSHYEAFYIRPTNGRADDQLRRNHSTQYIAMPDFPWDRLRRDHPGVYESYADMVAGQWTHLRIEVREADARLYVGAAQQPSLIVKNSTLRPAAAGGIALWVGPGTEAYFSNVKVAHAAE